MIRRNYKQKQQKGINRKCFTYSNLLYSNYCNIVLFEIHEVYGLCSNAKSPIVSSWQGYN